MDREEAQLYIGYLPNQARMSDVEEFFKGFGHIKSINLKPGYGFVVFEDRRDAEEAARDLDGKRMCGEKVDVEMAKGPGNKSRKEYSRSGDRPIVRDTRSGFNGRRRSRSRDRGFSSRKKEPYRDDATISITNLSTRCSWQDLKDFIRDNARVEPDFCDAHKYEDRIATVSFRSSSDMRKAVDRMDGFEIHGRKITAKVKHDPEANRSRSKSRSKSRSRSRSRSKGRRSRSRRRDDIPRRSPPRSRSPKKERDESKDRSRSRSKSK